MKKALIVSSWAPPMIGGPQNLYNLFSQLPKDDYSILTSYNSINNSKVNGIEGNWLPCQYYYFDRFKYTNIKSDHKNNNTNKIPNLKQLLLNLINIVPFIRKFIYGYVIPIFTIVKFTKATVKVKNITNAKLLFGISDTGNALMATYLTHIITKTPYILYFFDIYKENNLDGIYKYIAKFFEPTLVKKANAVIVTNDRTEIFFKDKYGNNLNTKVIYNSTFTKNYKQSSYIFAPQKPYKIVYTGNVYWPQEQSLINLIDAIGVLSDLPIELHLYIPSVTEHLKNIINNKSFIKLSSAAPSEMAKIQNSADILFLPLSWNTKSPEIIATATPGKFTDYLGSGKPILVHAPEYSYISQYVRKNELGIVVDKDDIKLLASSIRDFFNNPERGQIYIKNALTIFYKNHDAVKNAKILATLLDI